MVSVVTLVLPRHHRLQQDRRDGRERDVPAAQAHDAPADERVGVTEPRRGRPRCRQREPEDHRDREHGDHQVEPRARACRGRGRGGHRMASSDASVIHSRRLECTPTYANGGSRRRDDPVAFVAPLARSPAPGAHLRWKSDSHNVLQEIVVSSIGQALYVVGASPRRDRRRRVASEGRCDRTERPISPLNHRLRPDGARVDRRRRSLAQPAGGTLARAGCRDERLTELDRGSPERSVCRIGRDRCPATRSRGPHNPRSRSRRGGSRHGREQDPPGPPSGHQPAAHRRRR